MDRLRRYVLKIGSMGFDPVVDFGFGQSQNILGGIGGGLATAYVQEIQSAGSLIQSFFVTGRVTIEAADIFLDERSSFGVVFLLTDDLLH